jgi:uncharacterized membrane protein YfcA
MLALGFPALATVGVSQVLQVVSAAAGSVGNFALGTIDFSVALLLIPLELVGVMAGVALAHRMDTRGLRILAGLLCLVAGVSVALRAG